MKKHKCVVDDITGKRFARYLVLERRGSNSRGHSQWLCRCDCGTEKIVLATDLKRGHTGSCGCLLVDVMRSKMTTHGDSGTKIFRVWSTMISRCENPNNASYTAYGARGIAVCERWHKYENFIEDMGYPDPGMSIDRINPHGNYEPSNCRWATVKEQQNNRTDNRRVCLDGETKTISEWIKHRGLNQSTIYVRLSKGWPIEKALSMEDFRCRHVRHETV